MAKRKKIIKRFEREEDMVEIHPKTLRSTAIQLKNEAKRIQMSIDMVDSIIKALGPSVFEGNRADTLRSRYNQMRESLYSFKPFIERFSVELDDTATRFEIADRK